MRQSIDNQALLPSYKLLNIPEYIKHFGHKEGMFICQLHYWLSNSRAGTIHQGVKWIHNPAYKWAEQLHISIRTFQNIVKKLKDKGVLLVDKLSPFKGNRTNYYRLDYEKLNLLTGLSPDETIESSKRDSQKQIVQKMIAIWNNLCPKATTKLDQTKGAYLYEAFKRKFERDLNKWKEYCELISHNPWMSSDNFKLTIEWALKFNTITALLKGKYKPYVYTKTPSDKNKGMQEKEILERIKEHFSNLKESSRCIQSRECFIKSFGEGVYVQWMDHFHLREHPDGDQIEVITHTSFLKHYLEIHFFRLLKTSGVSSFRVCFDKTEHAKRVIHEKAA